MAAITRFRAAHIGFIFQQYNLIPTLTCVENVSVPLRIQGHGAATAEKRAAEMLDRVGLGPRLRHRPGQLSGGQQQRVAIARALVHEPRLLLADEPTGNLDPATAARVMQVLRDQARATGAALVLVTHSEAAAGLADRVLHLRSDGMG
jgi:putative ABC transport system ATP-binding protein